MIALLVCAGLEFTRREIVAKIHIGEATLAKRVTEFATTAAGDLTLEEFDQRGRALENEQMALLESTQPSEEGAAPGCCCIHIGAPCLCFYGIKFCCKHVQVSDLCLCADDFCCIHKCVPDTCLRGIKS